MLYTTLLTILSAALGVHAFPTNGSSKRSSNIIFCSEMSFSGRCKENPIETNTCISLTSTEWDGKIRSVRLDTLDQNMHCQLFRSDDCSMTRGGTLDINRNMGFADMQPQHFDMVVRSYRCQTIGSA